MENFSAKLRLESWIGRLLGRPEEKYISQGRPMARPLVRSDYSWTAADYPRPAVRRITRPARGKVNRVVLLGISFGLVLFAIILVCLVMIVQSVFGHTPAASSKKPLTAAAVVPTPIPGDPVKVLLLGSDQRPNDGGYRTDVIMLVQIDPKTQTVSVVSFPRDLWVKLPTYHDEMKINMVQQYGGFEAMAQMFQDNFGVRPDYYVLTNFGGFTGFIDSQGGVDVAVAQDLTDECSLPQAVDSNCSVKAGTIHMNGATALWYVRSRHSSSDFDRLRRAQEVLSSVFTKLFTLDSLARVSDIQAALGNNVETNMPFDRAMSFAPVAMTVLQSPDHIKRFAINEDQTTESISWNGMWILLQNPGAIPEVLKEAGIK